MCLLTDYLSLIFDCDGVILDSNGVKTEAFYKTALPYGENAAKALVNHHLENGGVSRYKKFEYFLEEVVSHGAAREHMNTLLARFSEEVIRGLSCCALARGLEYLREETRSASWFVVSGGDQYELRKIFRERSITHLFDGGIYGSPDTKDAILSRELQSGKIKRPAIFFGDSRYDHVVARNAGIDFIFISKWTEFDGWAEYCDEHHILVREELEDFVVEKP